MTRGNLWTVPGVDATSGQRGPVQRRLQQTGLIFHLAAYIITAE